MIQHIHSFHIFGPETQEHCGELEASTLYDASGRLKFLEPPKYHYNGISGHKSGNYPHWEKETQIRRSDWWAVLWQLHRQIHRSDHRIHLLFWLSGANSPGKETWSRLDAGRQTEYPSHQWLCDWELGQLPDSKYEATTRQRIWSYICYRYMFHSFGHLFLHAFKGAESKSFIFFRHLLD